MAAQLAAFFSSRCVPDEELASGRKGEAVNGVVGIVIAPEHLLDLGLVRELAERLARGRVPQSDRQVFPCRGEDLAVRRKTQAQHAPVVPPPNRSQSGD